MGPHLTEFRHLPFAHSSGRFCFAKPGGCQEREAWRGALGPHPTKFRHPPFAHSSGRFCFAKPDRCQGREAWRGALGLHPAGIQCSLFARLGRADVEKYGFGKDWAAISYNIQWGVHLSLSKSSGLTVKKSWLPGSRRRPRSGCPWKGECRPRPFFVPGRPPPRRGPAARARTPLCPAAQGRKGAACTGGYGMEFCLQPGGGYGTIISL